MNDDNYEEVSIKDQVAVLIKAIYELWEFGDIVINEGELEKIDKYAPQKLNKNVSSALEILEGVWHASILSSQ